MSNITKKAIRLDFLQCLCTALIGSVVAFGDNMAYAGGKHKKSNDAEQAIEQDQENKQNAQCVSGIFTIAGCNNVRLMFQNNDGNLALGQR